MLEELIGAAVRLQSGSLKRKATGAFVEAAALGLVGIALVFALIGGFLWLSERIDPSLAAFIVAAVVLVGALVLGLVGRKMMQQKSRRDREQLDRALGEVAPLAQAFMGKGHDGGLSPKSRTRLVAAALVTGIILGRSLRR